MMAALVSHWAAENTALDAVGMNHGTLVNGATYAAGQIGQSFRFDGVNDRILVQDSASFKLTESLTIEAWVMVQSFGTGRGEILFRGDDRAGKDPFQLCTEPGGVITFSIDSLYERVNVRATNVPLNQFIHVAATLEDTTGLMRVYLNGNIAGELVTATRPFADLDPTSNPGVGIGNHGGYPGTRPDFNFPFNGLIDELKLYNGALSSGEVLANYQAGAGSSAPPLDFLDRFVAEGSGGLQRPRMLTFGPDVTGDGKQELFVSSGDNDAVMRYDGATGAPLPAPNKPGAEFVSPGAGGLAYPGDLAFGPDNTLYVASSNTNAVLRFDGGSGEFLGTVVSGLAPTPETGSNGAPFGLTFGNDGNLYIANEGADEVLRYSPLTGMTSVFIPAGSGGLDRPRKVAFGPDANGDGVAELYVASPGTKQVLRYDGVSGGSPAVFFTTPLIAGPSWLEFGADGHLYTTGRTSALSLDAAVVRSDVVSGAVDRFDLRRDGLWFTLGSDNIVYNPGTSTGSFIDRFAETTNPDQTKFYVVNDGADRTFEYGETGALTQDYSITNTAPRGAAAAGFTTLVVDANKKVYVYDVHGSVLGSWTATGLSSTAQLEGVATNAADVWLVDNKTDTVLRYSKSAGRLSGSQSYDFGFYLNSGNKSPKDIVTDGTYLYVINDSTTDKVFKYTLTGSLVGSWIISTPGASKPTGITLDRGNPTHLYIVDNGTDRVYQYDNAVARTSGSQSASTWFALAAGNTNPQGIADPPPAARHASTSVAENSAASILAVPLTAVVPIDFLTRPSASSARPQQIDASESRWNTSQLVDRVVKGWGYPRERSGNSPYALGMPSTALVSSSVHRARFDFATDANDSEPVDDLLESTLDLMVPGLLADGWHGIRG